MNLATVNSQDAPSGEQIKAASFAENGAWARKPVLNLAGCGKFPSDYKIA